MPGEKIGAIQPLEFVEKHSALRLRAIRDAPPHGAGTEWLFEGPGLYMPSADVEIVERIAGVVLGPNDALHLRARRDCVDRAGVARKTGEKWLVTALGAYIVGVDEEIVQRVSAQILTPALAMHLRATQSFTDAYGKDRRVGDEWLVTREQAATHLLDVYETLVRTVPLTVLSPTQYAVVSNPCGADGKPQLGRQLNVVGPATLFARPGEQIEGPLAFRLLGPANAVWVTAQESFDDEGVQRKAGDRWLVFGPRAYVPPTQVTIVAYMNSVIAIPALDLYIFPTARFYSVVLLLVAYFIWWLFFSSGSRDTPPIAVDDTVATAATAAVTGSTDL
jgi:major vault protein